MHVTPDSLVVSALCCTAASLLYLGVCLLREQLVSFTLSACIRRRGAPSHTACCAAKATAGAATSATWSKVLLLLMMASTAHMTLMVLTMALMALAMAGAYYGKGNQQKYNVCVINLKLKFTFDLQNSVKYYAEAPYKGMPISGCHCAVEPWAAALLLLNLGHEQIDSSPDCWQVTNMGFGHSR